MEEPMEEDASEHAEVSAGGGRLVRETGFFKLRMLAVKVCQISHS